MQAIGAIDGLTAAQTFQKLMVEIWDGQAVETMQEKVDNPTDAYTVAEGFFKATLTRVKSDEDFDRVMIATFQDGSKVYIGNGADSLRGTAIWEYVTVN